MELMSLIALVLLTMVGYSGGSVVAARGRNVVPGLLDLALVAALWAGVVPLRDDLGKWLAILAGVALGALIGAGHALVRPMPPSDGRRRAAPDTVEGTGLLARWRRFAHALGNFQGRMVMGFFYFVVVTPFALIARLKDDRAPGGAAARASYWLDRPEAPTQLEQSRNQF